MSTQTLISEFMSTVDDVWTVRFTPRVDSEFIDADCDYFLKGVKKLFSEKKIVRYLVARENSNKGKRHFHLRFTTQLSESVVRKYFRKFICPISLKSQKFMVFHPCQIGGVLKDEKLWKSATYVCKDGDIVDSHGYTVSQISDLITYGNSLKVKGNDPIWLRVISRARLQQDASDQDIFNAMKEFYESLEKPLPQWNHIKAALHNIKYTLQVDYRHSLENTILSKMHNMSEF